MNIVFHSSRVANSPKTSDEDMMPSLGEGRIA